MTDCLLLYLESFEFLPKENSLGVHVGQGGGNATHDAPEHSNEGFHSAISVDCEGEEKANLMPHRHITGCYWAAPARKKDYNCNYR